MRANPSADSKQGIEPFTLNLIRCLGIDPPIPAHLIEAQGAFVYLGRDEKMQELRLSLNRRFAPRKGALSPRIIHGLQAGKRYIFYDAGAIRRIGKLTVNRVLLHEVGHALAHRVLSDRYLTRRANVNADWRKSGMAVDEVYAEVIADHFEGKPLPPRFDKMAERVLFDPKVAPLVREARCAISDLPYKHSHFKVVKPS
jgi:hypothetical protein